MSFEWKEYKFSEAIEIRPQRALKRGMFAPFIEMRAIEAKRRKPLAILRKRYMGSGAKFRNGDTLLARITPCLEHGKTVFISEFQENEVGFGSTEFIVLTGKQEVTDNLFVYYLCRYDEVRNFAIKSMTGSSGRQRVQEEAFNHLTIKIPPLSEQCKIAEILGSLDDKIELNYEMNKTIEAIAKAIFMNWFVDFEPFKDELVYNEELNKEIPKGWKVMQLGEILCLEYGRGLSGRERRSGDIPVYGSNGIVGWHNEPLVKGPGIIVGRKGTAGSVLWSHTDFYPIDTTFYVVPKGIKSMHYLYFELLHQNLPKLVADSAVPGLNRNIAYLNKTIHPDDDLIKQFENLVAPFFEMMYINDKETRILEQIRDSLLPKLLSGEVRVKVDVEKEFPEETKKLREIEEEKAKVQKSLDEWVEYA